MSAQCHCYKLICVCVFFNRVLYIVRKCVHGCDIRVWEQNSQSVWINGCCDQRPFNLVLGSVCITNLCDWTEEDRVHNVHNII